MPGRQKNWGSPARFSLVCLFPEALVMYGDIGFIAITKKKKIKERTLDKVGELISKQMVQLLKFLKLTSFIHVKYASQKDK